MTDKAAAAGPFAQAAPDEPAELTAFLSGLAGWEPKVFSVIREPFHRRVQ